MPDEEPGDLAALLDDVEAAVVDDLTSTPQQQVARATLQRVRQRLTAEARDATTSATPDDLPTIAYETESGERRRVRYERVPEQPWKVERRVDRHDGRTWVPCGADPLTELVVDGEHRAAVTLEGP